MSVFTFGKIVFICYLYIMKKIIWLFVLLFWFFFLAGCNTTNTVEEGNSNITNEEEIVKVMEKWGEITCTMEMDEDWVKASGVLYIDWDKVYTESKMNMMWKDIEAKSLMVWGYSYTWTSGDKSWTKFKLEDEEDESEFDFIQEEWIYEEDWVSYDCKKWIPSNINFKVPSDIDFKEFNESDFDLPF
jgi:hypothetical protein